MTRALLLAALLALAAPAPASAHATLLRTTPADGAVLDRAPRIVHVEFDDSIRAASGNAAVANATGSSVLGAEPRARGHVLTLPLRARLANGDYTVRWSIVSDDGHREQGVFAFAVGQGRASPHAVLGASSPLAWNVVALRALYYVGILVGAGAAVFWLVARSVLGARLQRPLAHLLFFALLASFLGASGIVHSAPPGTRFALVLKGAQTVALAGAAAAALAPTFAPLLIVAGVCAGALAAAPTLSGHALDPDQPRALAVGIDLAHVAGAAVWLGGLLSVLYVVPRATADDGERRAVARRFSSVALIAVAVLGLTGVGRALTELRSVSQIWSTSYGRTLIVKTALFIPLLVVGWLNRALLLNAFARLRRSVACEAAVIAGIVVAVAVLTELRPGTNAPRAVAGSVPLVALPPRDAVVDARELGTTAVAVARTPGSAVVTLLASDGTGADGRSVRVDGAAADSCGSGCYRARAGAGTIRVEVDERPLVFGLPAQAPNATELLRDVTRAYRASRTVVFDERLASSPTNTFVTRFEVVSPNRLSYRTRGGAAAIVIGARRWDRETPRAPWRESDQSPLDVTRPYWGDPTNVHLVAPGVITFLDRRIPAWFRVTLAGSRPRRVRMTAAAHFMVDSYVGFDVPVTVSPPPSR